VNREELGRCPICDNNLKVTEIACGSCGTSIRGKFDPCKFVSSIKNKSILLKFSLKTEVILRKLRRNWGFHILQLEISWMQ